MTKKILMVCYYYPPLADVGCKRSVAFAKFWKKAGWHPYVLSVKNPDPTYCTPGNEPIPEGIPVVYTHSLLNIYKPIGMLNALLTRLLSLFGITYKKNYLHYIFCIPDVFIGWIPLAVWRGLQLIKKHKIDTIYVSCSPFSSGIVGLLLKKLTKKSLVIDYRDPFGVDLRKYQKNFHPLWFRKNIDNWIAKQILNNSDLFTVTTEETKQLYEEQFPQISHKIHTVYNGFDHTLLGAIGKTEKFKKFTIIYYGNFYYEIKFEYFFESLGLLKKNNIINEDNFQFLFYGGIERRIQSILIQYDIIDLVKVRSRIPYKNIISEIKNSHLQLLRIAQPMISTKLFEGIALNIPFLALIPKGEVEEIVKKFSPASYIVTDEDAKKIKNTIIKSMRNYKKNEIKDNLVDEFLNFFSRSNQSKKYIRLMEKCSNVCSTKNI